MKPSKLNFLKTSESLKKNLWIKKSEIQIKANTYNYNNELIDISTIVENEFEKGKGRGPDDKKFIKLIPIVFKLII